MLWLWLEKRLVLLSRRAGDSGDRKECVWHCCRDDMGAFLSCLCVQTYFLRDLDRVVAVMQQISRFVLLKHMYMTIGLD